MPRIPLLHLLLIALCALALGAVPALAAAPAAPSPAATASVSDDDWEDDEDWEDEGDWGDEECVFVDDDGEPLPPEECDEEDWDLCLAGDDEEWEDWSDEELAAEDEWGDDWSEDDEWSDEDGDDTCAEDGSEDDAAGDGAEGAAPPRLSKLKAKPVRRGGGVRVSFRLDRDDDVVLALRRVEGARASGRCAHGARAAKRGGTPSGRKARRCPRPRACAARRP